MYVASADAIEDVVTIGFLLLVNLSFMELKVSANTSSDSSIGITAVRFPLKVSVPSCSQGMSIRMDCQRWAVSTACSSQMGKIDWHAPETWAVSLGGFWDSTQSCASFRVLCEAPSPVLPQSEANTNIRIRHGLNTLYSRRSPASRPAALSTHFNPC